MGRHVSICLSPLFDRKSIPDIGNEDKKRRWCEVMMGDVNNILTINLARNMATSTTSESYIFREVV